MKQQIVGLRINVVEHINFLKYISKKLFVFDLKKLTIIIKQLILILTYIKKLVISVKFIKYIYLIFKLLINFIIKSLKTLRCCKKYLKRNSHKNFRGKIKR